MQEHSILLAFLILLEVTYPNVNLPTYLSTVEHDSDLVSKNGPLVTSHGFITHMIPIQIKDF